MSWKVFEYSSMVFISFLQRYRLESFKKYYEFWIFWLSCSLEDWKEGKFKKKFDVLHPGFLYILAFSFSSSSSSVFLNWAFIIIWVMESPFFLGFALIFVSSTFLTKTICWFLVLCTHFFRPTLLHTYALSTLYRSLLSESILYVQYKYKTEQLILIHDQKLYFWK